MAEFKPGASYEFGNGVTKDYTKAVMWYRKAAEQGMASAQYFLGGCYRDGKGVGTNIVEAVTWFRKAAE
jgi:TPR repeat protein